MRGGKKVKGILTGAMLGAAAATVVGMMNRQTQQKIRKFATTSGQRLADKANDLFGR